MKVSVYIARELGSKKETALKKAQEWRKNLCGSHSEEVCNLVESILAKIFIPEHEFHKTYFHRLVLLQFIKDENIKQNIV